MAASSLAFPVPFPSLNPKFCPHLRFCESIQPFSILKKPIHNSKFRSIPQIPIRKHLFPHRYPTSKSEVRFQGHCYRCRRMGHMAIECKDPVVCHSCGRPSHVRASCKVNFPYRQFSYFARAVRSFREKLSDVYSKTAMVEDKVCGSKDQPVILELAPLPAEDFGDIVIIDEFEDYYSDEEEPSKSFSNVSSLASSPSPPVPVEDCHMGDTHIYNLWDQLSFLRYCRIQAVDGFARLARAIARGLKKVSPFKPVSAKRKPCSVKYSQIAATPPTVRRIPRLKCK